MLLSLQWIARVEFDKMDRDSNGYVSALEYDLEYPPQWQVCVHASYLEAHTLPHTLRAHTLRADMCDMCGLRLQRLQRLQPTPDRRLGFKEDWTFTRAAENGTQFTCFIMTKVQILTPRGAAGTANGIAKRAWDAAFDGTQFTCFASTKVQILTAALRYATAHDQLRSVAERSCQCLYFCTSKASKLSTTATAHDMLLATLKDPLKRTFCMGLVLVKQVN
jgi:hypothetical protein